MANKLKVIVLDILKPHRPDIIEFGMMLEKEKSVKCLNMSVYAVDEKTESVKVAMEGKSINLKSIRKIVEDAGAVIHSTDKAIIGQGKIIQVPELK